MRERPIILSGRAVGDGGHGLRGPSLTWLDGRHPLGHGERLAIAHGLAAGRHVLRLAPATPSVGSEWPPCRSASAQCHPVGGHRFAVGRRTRRIMLHIRPGRGALRLTLRLTSGRLMTKAAVVIARR